jgi:hypothetical protein
MRRHLGDNRTPDCLPNITLAQPKEIHDPPDVVTLTLYEFYEFGLPGIDNPRPRSIDF